jgi:two-component sensor histidine kinase
MRSGKSAYMDPDDPEARPDLPDARCASCWVVDESDHRIANHLAMLAGFVQQKASELSRQSGGLDFQQAQLTLQTVRLQIGLTARLHRSLTHARGLSVVDLADHLRELCTSLLSLAPAKVELVEDFQPGCLVGATRILPLSCMIAEVLTNSVKHAVLLDRTSLVKVGCRSVGDGAVKIEISDNGPGLPPGFDPSKDGGFGFQLLRALGKQLGAMTDFASSTEGLLFQVVLPSEWERPG